MTRFSSKAITAAPAAQTFSNFAKLTGIGLALGAMLVAVPPASAEETRLYDFKNFSKINISEDVDGRVIRSDQFKVSAEAKNVETLDNIVIKLQGDTLTIQRKDENLLKTLTDWLTSESPKVYISLPILTEAKSSAGADLFIEEFTAKSLELEASSGANIYAKSLQVNDIMAQASSGGEVELAGTCTDAEMSASSGAEIDAQAFECKSVEVDASSGGRATVFASENLQANASSGARITAHGEATRSQSNSSSGGEVEIK